MGCSVSALRMIEGGERRPSAEFAEELALHLGVKPEEREGFLRLARTPLRAADPAGQEARGGPDSGGSPQPPPNNLPARATPLVGRGRELGEVRARLALPDVRLLTLTGPGGIGKTRLALAAAEQLLGGYPDGAWLVRVDAMRDPELTANEIARALGVAETPGGSLEGALGDYLRDKRALLLLDGFEHMTGAAPLVAELLAAAPGLRVLATSQAPLHLSAEHELPVPALPLPEEGETSGAESLGRYGAAELFARRARAVSPGFSLTDSNAGDVLRLLRALGGVPLAIELAAARVKLLSPPEMLGYLDRKLELLTGGARDLPPRQRSLRATLDWSHGLLGPGAQLTLARLSAFEGGCTLAAAREVCGEGGAGQAVEGELGELLDNSLLCREAGPGGESRLTMLETVREYAAERLGEMGEADDVRGWHAGYYLGLAERAEPELTGPEQGLWLDRLEAEHANLRSALGWLLRGGQADAALRICAALWRFWLVRGYLSEGRRWLGRALEAAPGGAPPELRARTLAGAGMLAARQGDLARSAELHEEALRLRREAGDPAGVAASLNQLGLVELDRGRHPEAGALLRESLAAYRELGDLWGEATTLNNLGLLRTLEGDWRGALALHRRSLELRRGLGDRRGEAMSLHNLGTARALAGDLQESARLQGESLAMRRGLGDRAGEAGSLWGLALAALLGGEHGRAGELWHEALGNYEELGERLSVAECLEGLAAVAGTMGEAAESGRLWRAAAAVREGLGAPLPPAFRGLYARYLDPTPGELSAQDPAPGLFQ